MSMEFTIPRHAKCGFPANSYVYRNALGKPVLVANRYERKEGGKFFLPYDVACKEWKVPKTRPIYNLDKISAADAATPVIVVEGEKCADALERLGFLTTTTFGGSNAVAKSDLSPLLGRQVYIWPDNDLPGRKYADALIGVFCETLKMRAFRIPISNDFLSKATERTGNHGFAKGWDAADAVAQGWTRKDVEKLLGLAVEYPANTPKMDESSLDVMESIQLWHTPEKEAFASLSIGNHIEHWALDSSHFRSFLAYHHYQSEGKMLSQTALEDRRRTMAGEALFGGSEHPVATRIASIGNTLHIDLGDADWSSVQISAGKWEVTRKGPARFQRAHSMQPLPYPRKGGSIDQLRPFLNVASETDFRMLVAWLLGCFHPKGPYPILILTGEQGSAKSTTAKVLRSLIDPATPIARSAPQSEQDLVIAAKHNHVLAFDNLSHIKPTLADALCRIATGGGFGTRKLHTNSEEVLFNATRPVLLNGIPDLASRPDLADRSIIVTLPELSGTKRKFETEFWRSFESQQSEIFGYLLGIVAVTMQRLSSVSLTEHPRMADFARWVTAAEPALGWPEGAFMEAYNINRNSVSLSAIEGNPVAEAILCLLADHGPWHGTATELVKALRRSYPLLTDDPHNFPRSPQRLSSELRRVMPLIRKQGGLITFERQGKTGQRVISIETQ